MDDRSSSHSPPSFRRQTHRFHSGGSNSGHENDSSVLLPTWSANPQSPAGDDGTPHGTFSTTQQYNRRHFTWLPSCQVVVLGVAFLATMVAVLQSRGSLIYSMEEVAQFVHNNKVLRNKLNDAEKGIKLLQREVSALDVMHQPNGNNIVIPPTLSKAGHPAAAALLAANSNPHNNPNHQALQEMQQLSSRLQDSQKHADKLKTKVQRLSKTEALAKYGDHVHRVEIELSFPDGRDGPTRFVIELAPIELMPHSVHFFLEMVSSHLLDGCSFILNALHVLKAAPLPYDGSSAANKARAFTRMGLESVAFKEYAASYPHEQYTVGFAADGSPSFYINTEDNSEIHLGDPCFGKIVEGFDTVKRLEASPTRNGIWFEQRIGIKKATVLM